MQTQTPTGGVAVVTTTLAHTDRRALSQAWYSALHFAERALPHSVEGVAHASANLTASPQRDPLRAPPRTAAAGSALPFSSRRARDACPADVALERRARVNGLGRRIARVLARRPAFAAARTATVTVRGGRVHVIVRTQGGTTRIVALCPAALQTRVAQALAHARFGLAASGVRLEVVA